MRFTLILVVTLLGLANVVHAAPTEVDIPEFPVWCASSMVHLTPNSADNEAAKVMAAFEGTLQQEALAKKLLSIGVPFVTDIAASKNNDGSSDNKITACAAVPDGSPKPDGNVIEAREPHRRGLALICDAKDLDACNTMLEKAMSAAPWSLSADALKAATRRDHPALKADPSADNLVNSLTHAKDILIVGAATPDTAPALQSSNVVLAILVQP